MFIPPFVLQVKMFNCNKWLLFLHQIGKLFKCGYCNIMNISSKSGKLNK